jgi:hypothetical protein
MAAGKKTGGRQKGTKNKATEGVEAKLKDLKCDPIEGMANIARQAMDQGDMPLAGQMYKELAQYVAPKRKAMELTGANGDPIETSSTFNFIPVGSED